MPASSKRSQGRIFTIDRRATGVHAGFTFSFLSTAHPSRNSIPPPTIEQTRQTRYLYPTGERTETNLPPPLILIHWPRPSSLACSFAPEDHLQLKLYNKFYDSEVVLSYEKMMTVAPEVVCCCFRI
jgi:hypothetical protein